MGTADFECINIITTIQSDKVLGYFGCVGSGIVQRDQLLQGFISPEYILVEVFGR